MDYSERQGHGLKYENLVIQRYNINKDKNYTDEWDGLLGDTPVSIKCIKKGAEIDLASFKRNAMKTSDFYLIVGFWEDKKDNIVEEHVLLINGKEWHQLFPLHFIDDFDEMLNNITNDRSDDAKWKKMISEQRKQWKLETDNLIRPRFKRDHKTQKRIQCAISNQDFYSYFLPKYEVADVR